MTCWSSNRASEGEKGDLRDLERGMVVCARWAGLSISETADLLGFSSTTISRVYREWFKKRKYPVSGSCVEKCLVDVRGQRRMGRLVRDDRKTTVTQITTRYNQICRNHLWTHNTSNPEADGLQQQKTTPVPLLSDKNSTEDTIHTGSPKLDNRRLKKRCLVWWVSISAATFRCRVRIWRKEHESMDLSCLVSRFRLLVVV